MAAQKKSAVTAQFRIEFSKKDVVIEGPDDADVIVKIAAKDAALDPTLAFMTGKLKNDGSTGALFEVLSSGEAAEAISRLASRP